MVDLIPEYKYSLYSLFGFVALLFYNYIPLIDGFSELIYAIFSWTGPILIILGLSSIAYFYYGYKRTRNTATMNDYKIANYFVPNKRKVYTTLIVFAISYVFVAIVLNLPRGGPFFYHPGAISSVMLITYFLQPLFSFLWKKPVWKKILKIAVILLLMLSGFFAYELNVASTSGEYIRKGHEAIVRGDIQGGLDLCKKAGENIPLIGKIRSGISAESIYQGCLNVVEEVEFKKKIDTFIIEHFLKQPTQSEIDSIISLCKKQIASSAPEGADLEVFCKEHLPFNPITLSLEFNKTLTDLKTKTIKDISDCVNCEPGTLNSILDTFSINVNGLVCPEVYKDKCDRLIADAKSEVQAAIESNQAAQEQQAQSPAQPTETTTAPTQTCGNGIAEGTEACDGADLRGYYDCTLNGYASGKFTCTSDCKIDSSQCANPTCTDSDGGLNYFVKGTVNEKRKEPYGNVSFVDECTSSNQLSEQYCNPTATAAQYSCPNGCNNGACNP